jgi:hypothetical protein
MSSCNLMLFRLISEQKRLSCWLNKKISWAWVLVTFHLSSNAIFDISERNLYKTLCIFFLFSFSYYLFFCFVLILEMLLHTMIY